MISRISLNTRAWFTQQVTCSYRQSVSRHQIRSGAGCFLQCYYGCTGRRFSSSSDGGQETNSERSKWIGRFAFSIPIAVTFGLGVWQSRRYFEKIEEIEVRTTDLSKHEVDLDKRSNVEDWSALLYKKVTVTGTFDHNLAMFVGPRSAPTGGLTQGGSGLMSAPGKESGFFVVTPFKVKQSGQWILVSRGWIPRRMRENYPLSAGEERITLVLTPQPKAGSLAPKNDPSQNSWFSVDLSAMSDYARLPEVAPFAELIEPATPGQFPRPKKEGDLINFYVTPVTHLSYAATWYMLSGAMAVATYFRFR
uniref:SURF1-like protein n=1 Tax=Hanusia phi TaxID=3032 RepID=A0A7S0HYY9_9CRYP